MNKYLFLVWLFVLGLFGPARAMAQSSDPVIVTAGDISCSSSTVGTTFCHQMKTSDLALWINPIAVLTLGDNQYPDGTLSTFNTYYEPSWGRLKRITRPVPGNHEYNTSGAAGYYGYFGSAAGDPNKGYYSYNIGSWHIIALNSEIARSTGSVQEQWLRSDLAANPRTCTLAYWHKPRFSSGNHGSDTSVRPFWQALYDYKADVVLSGHDHDYERFAPQGPSGLSDFGGGIRQFVVGTGGKSLYSFGTAVSNSEFRFNSGFGILKLTLRPTSYEWQFISDNASHTVLDSGSGNCVTGAVVSSPTGTAAATPAPVSGSSDNYYVSPQGSDSSPGTLSQPFKTLQKATNAVGPGDTVWVRSGVYNQAWRITKSGTATGRITFKNYPNETPVIDGGGLSISYYGALVTIGSNSSRTNYVTLSGFVVQNSPAAGINIRGNYNVLDKMKVTRSHARAIDFDNSSYSTLQKSEITNNVLCNENGKRGCNNAPTWPINIGVTNADHIKVIDNYVRGNWGEGIASWRGSDSSQIVGNRVVDNWSVDIYLDNAKNSIVERNLVSELDASDGGQKQKIANGISIADENYGRGCPSSNNAIRNNIIAGTRRGISFFNYQPGCSGIKNTVIEHNTIVDTREQAILINSGSHSGSSIRNNILYPRNSGSSSSFSGISSANNLTQDPKLVNINASSATAENYKLTSGSPAIDGGIATATNVDYWNTPRPQGGKFDIGAHEFTSTAVPTATRVPTFVPTSTAVPTRTRDAEILPPADFVGDADCDGAVNEMDLEILIGQFGKPGGACPADADFNDDNVVDGVDFAIWLRTFETNVQTSPALTRVDTGAGVGVELMVESQIGSSADDVNEEKGVLDTYYPSNYGQLWLGDGGAVGRGYAGLRFTNVDVPAKASIVSAKLKFFSAKGQWINMDMNIAAEASGNSLTFSDSSVPSGRQLTKARVNHSSNVSWSSNAWYELDDMAAVIQEVINRDDWVRGNSMAVILKGVGRQWGRKFVVSWDGKSETAPKLVIKYIER